MRDIFRVLVGCCFLALFTLTASAETWVTLEKVDVDRCASAWLITRFIDEDPKFVFFEQGKEGEAPKGIGYDYFGAKYFHKGSDCTFTALIKAYGLNGNKALQRMNNDVNDVFSWRWPPGSFPVRFREHIGVLRAHSEDDIAIYKDLFATFDLLYWSYGGEFGAFSFSAEELRDSLFARTAAPFDESKVSLSTSDRVQIPKGMPDERWEALIQKIAGDVAELNDRQRSILATRLGMLAAMRN